MVNGNEITRIKMVKYGIIVTRQNRLFKKFKRNNPDNIALLK